MLRAIAAVWVVVAFAAPARAQIVNVQSMLASEAPEGASGSITGAADWRTGNANLLSLAAAPLARYRSGFHLFIATWRGEIKMVKARPDAPEYDDIVKKSFAHARYRYTITKKLLGEVFTQHELDEFRRLKLRFVAGAGPKYDLVQTDEFSFAAAVAYMIEYEDLDNGYVDEDGDGLRHRISSYVVSRYKLNDNIDVADTLYLQPRINDFGDFRLLNDAELVAKLTDKVAFTTTFSIAYDHRPPEPIDPAAVPIEDLDTTLKTSITISF